MGTTFGDFYSSIYDELYSEKDYESECALVDRIIRANLGNDDSASRSILDLGCGTAGHAIPLSKMNYKVVGVDPSAQMLASAKQKALAQGAQIKFLNASSQDFECAQSFDACICMFAVFCYHQSNDEILAALKRIVRHLKPGGLFLMDFWFGPAVLQQKPETRVRFLDAAGVDVCRIVTPSLDVCAQTVSTHYDVIALEKNKPAVRTSETHVMRYFFLKELELFCAQVGMSVKQFGEFPEIEQTPSHESWNVMMIAQRDT